MLRSSQGMPRSFGQARICLQAPHQLAVQKLTGSRRRGAARAQGGRTPG